MSDPIGPAFARSRFRKASRSGTNPQACVEVARGHGRVEIRDSKRAWNAPDDHRLVFRAAQFDAFLDGVRNGEFA